MDIEKIIEEFNDAKELVWLDDDEYTVGYNNGIEAGKNIVLALLKEQEAMKECLKRKCVICPHCENCDVDENGVLKEQEAKTGYWIDSAGNDKCSICGEEYSDLYPDYGNTHFYPNCGAKMKGREVNG